VSANIAKPTFFEMFLKFYFLLVNIKLKVKKMKTGLL